MASKQEVKRYLAYWFQLGKKLILNNGREQQLLPQPVIARDRYSQQFEAVWQKIIKEGGKNWYLEGTSQTIAELLSPVWELADCARCGMPVPMIDLGLQQASCPCSDLSSWPNLELPKPRSPVDSNQHFLRLQERLNKN
jgi:hypothetical protein